ncbi:hypothetical protein JL721_4153 [Aureococcus anophagefferens]|nr:hypothetical protein JL721_4153 [Aureococcus anophagefferens]
MDAETAESLASVFESAIASVAGVDADSVGDLTFSSGRRRLDDASSVDVGYALSVDSRDEAEEAASTMGDADTSSMTEALVASAAEAGEADAFASVTTSALGAGDRRARAAPATAAPTGAFLAISAMGVESTCVHDVACEVTWVYRGDAAACATLDVSVADVDGNVVATTTTANDGSQMTTVSGDAEVNEYTLALACADDPSLADAVAFRVSFTPAPTRAPSSRPTSGAPTLAPTAPSLEITAVGTLATCVSGVDCYVRWDYVAPRPAGRSRELHPGADAVADDPRADDGPPDDPRADDGRPVRRADAAADDRAAVRRRPAPRRRREPDRVAPAADARPDARPDHGGADGGADGDALRRPPRRGPRARRAAARAAFSATGAEVVVELDAESDMGGAAAGEVVDCAEVLAFAGADGAACYWSSGFVTAGVSARSTSRRRQRHGRRGRAAAVLRPGTGPLRLRAAQQRVVGGRGAAGPAARARRARRRPRPRRRAGLSLGSSQSTGGGGRELAYAWNATLTIAPGAPAANASAARERLRGALAAANAGGGSANLALTSDDLVALAGGGAYRLDVVLALANFLGGASEPSEPFAVALRTDAPPQLTIVGGVVREATRPGALSIRVNAIATSCDGRPAASRAVAIAFSLDYAVFTDGSAFGTATVNSAFDLEPTGLASTSSDQRYFKLPAYSLAAATYYRLAVTATDVAGGSNVTSYVRLDVARSSVVAVVAGGDRVAPLAGTLALDCVKINHCERDGAGGGRTATVTIELVDDDPPAVAIDAGGARVASSTKVVLYGEASPSSLGRAVSPERRFNTTWRVVAGDLENAEPLSYWARTPYHASAPAGDRDHDLVLAVGSGRRARRDAAWDATLEDGGAAGAASITFYVAKPPSAGRVFATPGAGYALETEFDLETTSWVTEDFPLSYAFKSRSNASESTLRAPTLEATLADVILPEGSPNVTVFVVAIDALGGGEAVCQTAVAAAGAAAGDADLTATMVDAVGPPPRTPTPVVEQTSSALASVASNGTGLEPSAASSALDAVGALAGSSTGVGITEAAAAGLGDTLSRASGSAAARARTRRRGGAASRGGAGAWASTATARTRRRGRRRVVVGIDIESLSLEKIIQKMIGANLTCDCGFVGTKTFLCKDNATILNNTCDGGPGSSVEAFCPIMVDTCSSFAAGANGSAGSWVPTCETVEQDDGSTSCRCDIFPDEPAADFGISDEYGNVGDVYFSNLTSPPDLSRAVYVIYALAALIGACLFFHDLDDDDPYEVPEGVQKMLDPALKRWHTGLCIDHPFYSYWFYHSHSAGRAGRAWFCGFEILMFLYSVAFHTNLVFPDVEDQCAAYATYTKCLGLKTYLRGKMDFGRWHLEPADLCEWDMCSQACFMAEPVIGDMSATYYFILAVMFVVLLPVVKIFEFMAEGYLMAPVPPCVPPAIAELCCCVAEHVEDHWTRAPAQAYMKHTNTKRELLKAQSRMFPGDAEEGDGDVLAADGAELAADGAEPPAAVDEAVRGAGDERAPPVGAPSRAPADGEVAVPSVVVDFNDVEDDDVGAAFAEPPDDGGAVAIPSVVVDFGAGHEESKTVEPFLSPPPPLAKILDERGAAFAPPVASPVASDDEDGDAEDGSDDGDHAEEEAPAATSAVEDLLGEHGPRAVDMLGSWVDVMEANLRASLNMEKVAPKQLKATQSSVLALLKTQTGLAASDRDARARACAKRLGPLVVEAVLMRSDEIRAQEACGATPGTRKRLREINDAFLAKWHGHLLGEWSAARRDRHVEAVLAKRILRALDWHDAMAEDAEAYARERLDAAEEDGGAVDAESFRDALTRRKEATLVDHLRSEILTSTERTVFAVCSDRLLGVPLDPPDEPPSVRSYVVAWLGMAVLMSYMAYYLITTGSQFGLEKSRQWLTSVGISVGLYFAFIKPIVCMIVYVFIPGVVNGIVAAASRPLERRRFPFKTPLPDSSTAFLLQWHPELAGTPAAEHVLATLGKGEAPGTIDQRNRDERALTKAEVLGIHEDFVPSRSVVVTVAVVLASGLFQLNDDIQEVILEEVFCFTPMISGPIVGFIPLPESSVGKGGISMGRRPDQTMSA